MTKEQAYDFIVDWCEDQSKKLVDFEMEKNGNLTDFERGIFSANRTIREVLKYLNEKISSSEAQ